MTIKQSDLRYFTGTEQYYYLPLFPKFKYTDGVKYVAENGGAYWLIEKIFALQSHGKIADNLNILGFQVWKLHVSQNNSASLVCEGGDGEIVFVGGNRRLMSYGATSKNL